MLGIGFAATRDLNSFFRYEKKDDAGHAESGGRQRCAGRSRRAARSPARSCARSSGSGSIRTRPDASCGTAAIRTSRRACIDLNRRFALPGGDVELYELGTEAPVWWEDWNDAPRGRGTSGLLDRCRATNTCPKIMETFGSAEIWNLRASFMLVGTDAKADIPLPDNVRRYFFPGVTHGGGRGGFSSAETAANGCELPANPAPSAPMRSALMKALVAWVTTGAAMPPSRYPTIADGTLVPDTSAALRFPAIPGTTVTGASRPLLDYDLGPNFNYQDASGVLDGGAEDQTFAAAARRQGRCGRQRSGRHQVAAASRRRSARTPDGT